MIDGIQFTYHSPDENTFLLDLPIWEILVNEKSGERVDDIRGARLRGLDLKLKPSIKNGYNLLVNGSLHKFHNCGIHNADNFSFSKLQQSIDSLTDIFGVEAHKCKLHGLEIGVNMPLAYSPLKILKSLVSYRNKTFTQINKNSVRKGMQCSLSQYALKVYDKENQSGVACGYTLRFEVAIRKMQVIRKFGILTLADLQEPKKVYALVEVLKDALEGIVWTDGSVNLDRLTLREQKQWLSFSNPKVWGLMNKYKRKRSLRVWKNLLHKYGNVPNLFTHLKKTWDGLFNDEFEAAKQPPIYHLSRPSEAHENATFLPLECTVKKLPNLPQIYCPSLGSFPIIKNCNTNILEDKLKQNKRHCKSCGRDISKQKSSAVFCSETFYGQHAKKCRNMDSNVRRNKRAKVQRAFIENTYLAISYVNADGQEFTDLLQPSEINPAREWLDRISKIEIIKTKSQNYLQPECQKINVK